MAKSLADLVREKVDAGVLPLEAPAKIWICLGSGRLCAACGQSILFTEYEPLYNDNRAAIRFHAGCLGLWEAERRRRSSLPSKGSFDNPPKRRSSMMKFLAVAFAVASVLLVAPIIESGTPVSTQLFVAIGNADGGGGE